MQVESLSSTDKEHRSEVQCLLNRCADMEEALDEQVIKNMIEDLTQDVLADSPKASARRRQVRVRPP